MQPLSSRRAVVKTLVGNVRDGLPVVRVSREDPTRNHRLMLLVDETQKGQGGSIWSTFRPFVPFYHYLDYTKTFDFMIQDGKPTFNDPLFLGHWRRHEQTGPHQVQTVRTLADHMRLVTMFVRWREHVGAKNRRRGDVLKLCLLTCGRSDVIKVLHDESLFV